MSQIKSKLHTTIRYYSYWLYNFTFIVQYPVILNIRFQNKTGLNYIKTFQNRINNIMDNVLETLSIIMVNFYLSEYNPTLLPSQSINKPQ